MKILFLTGNSQYNAFEYFLSDMRADLELMSVSTDVCQYQDGEDYTHINLNQYDKIISFNGIGLNITAADGDIKQFKSSSVLVWLLDHPLHLLPRIISFPVTVLCMDQEHVPFCRLCGLAAFYFPHSISQKNATEYLEVENLENGFDKKENDIVMPVSYFDAEEQKRKLAPIWSKLEPAINNSENITDFLQQIGVLPTPGRGSVTQLNQDIFNISTLMNMYLRAKSRTSLMQHCADYGLKLNVIGRNVIKYKEDFPDFSYFDELPMTALNEKVTLAKYVVHNTPGFRAGLHDRPLNAMLRGTLVITDSSFMMSEFPNSCIGVEQVIELSKREYISRIRTARQILLEKHTWYGRFKRLFDELSD